MTKTPPTPAPVACYVIVCPTAHAPSSGRRYIGPAGDPWHGPCRPRAAVVDFRHAWAWDHREDAARYMDDARALDREAVITPIYYTPRHQEPSQDEAHR
jgi:hypothetical protein